MRGTYHMTGTWRVPLDVFVFSTTLQLCDSKGHVCLILHLIPNTQYTTFHVLDAP